ncbi:MAG: hypothetical protein ABR575_02765 [Actinomycetota bacterium]
MAVLLGLMSATVAIDLATNLYAEWGWAFKLAAIGSAAAAIGVVRKRSRRCSTKPDLLRFTAILSTTAIVTYGLLYAGTTTLAERASASAPITLRGSSPEAQVVSAVTQVRERYRDVTIHLQGASSSAVRFRIAFTMPNVDPSTQEYVQEISRRVGDSREATLLLLQTIATQVPSIRGFSAFDDLIFVPTWSREQVLNSQDPQEYRDFDTYTRFVMSAETLGGYSQLQNR